MTTDKPRRLFRDPARFRGSCLILPLLCLMPLLCLLPAAPAAGQTPLRWKLSPGQRLTLDYRQQQEATVTLSSGRVATRIDLRMQLDWNVQRVTDEGLFEIRQNVERLQVTTRQGEGSEIVYDSNLDEQTSQEAGRIAEALAPLLKQSVLVTMNPRGEVLQVSASQPNEAGDTANTAGDTANAAGDAAEDSAPGESGLGGPALWRDAQQQLLGQAGVVFPDEAVAAGESWTRARRVGGASGMFQVVSEYTVQGAHAQGGLEIQVRSRIVLPESVSPTRFRIRNQKNEGTLRFDAEAGRLLSSQARQELTTEKTYADTRIVVKATSTLELDVTSR